MNYTQIQLSEQNVLLLLRQCDDDFIPCLSKSLFLEQYAKKLSENAFFIIAKESDNLFGFVAYYKNYSEGCLYVPLIWVSSKSQRRGIGQKLISLLTSLDNNHFHSIMLEVLKTNVNAFAFYKKEKFEIVEDRNEKWLLKRNINS